MSLVYDAPEGPREGYVFSDPSGVTLRADSLRGLVAKIASFREVNGMAAGCPEAELEAIYRVKYPHLVTRVTATAEPKPDHVERWVAAIWRDPPKASSLAEADTVLSRLGQCATCAFYRPETALSVGTVRRALVLSGGRMSDFSACEAHGWLLGLAALFRQPPHARQVSSCWASGLAPHDALPSLAGSGHADSSESSGPGASA